MSQILSGKDVAEALSSEIAEALSKRATAPKLVTLRVGANPSDMSYETGVTKKFKALGLDVANETLPEDVTQENLESAIKTLNQRDDVNGILLFQPLPKHLDMEPIRSLIEPEKDIDGSTYASMGKLFAGKPSFVAGAPAGVMALLSHYQIPLEGKTVALIGRSSVVGKPLAMLLTQANATVTICHSNTKNLPELCRNSEILITSVGVPNFITEEFVHSGQIVIDVSTNVVEGKLCGDLDPQVHDKVKAYTPTPGGTGAVTTSIMAKQLLRL